MNNIFGESNNPHFCFKKSDFIKNSSVSKHLPSLYNNSVQQIYDLNWFPYPDSFIPVMLV